MKYGRKAAALFLAAVLLCVCLSGCSGSKAKYTVGVCQLTQHPALDAATQGFADTLKEKLGDEVRIVVQNASNDTPTCTNIVNNFVSDHVDLILANATPALQAAAAATNSIPILGTSVTDYATALDIADWTGSTGRNISGSSDLAPLSEQAAMLHELFPDAKNVGLLYCSAEPNSVYQCGIVETELKKFGYNVKWYAFSDSNDLASVTTTACAESDVLYIPTDNTVADNTEVINNIALPAKTPIVAGEEGICRGCGVATLSISYYDIGKAAGEMAYRILCEGADVASMPVAFAEAATKKYDAERCQALGVTVPSGYETIGG